MIEDPIIGYDIKRHLRCKTNPLILEYADTSLKTEIFRDGERGSDGNHNHGSDVYVERAGRPIVDIPVGDLQKIELAGMKLLVYHNCRGYKSPLSLGRLNDVDLKEFVGVANEAL